MRTSLAGPLLLVLALLLAPPACGKKAVRPAPPSPAPPAAPPGLDPEAVRAYEAAPVPEPVPFAASPLRAEALAGGAFEGIPSGAPESLPALLAAFAAMKEADAADRDAVRRARGPSFIPSREQMRSPSSRTGSRPPLRGRPPTRRRPRGGSRDRGLAIEGLMLEVVTSKVFGTGYVKTIEARPVTIAAPD